MDKIWRPHVWTVAQLCLLRSGHDTSEPGLFGTQLGR